MKKPNIRDNTNKKAKLRTKAKNRKASFSKENRYLKKTKHVKNLNKKIKNAKKQTFAGINFKSGLEVYAYKKLLENEIDVKYEETSYPLIDSFEYMGEKIRGAKVTPDFVGKDFIIETKGWATDVFKLRWKLFKKYLYDNKINIRLYTPKNQEEVDKCIEDIIKYTNNGIDKNT